MRRAICWILIIAIMLGFIGMISLQAFAAVEKLPGIGDVYITVTGLEVGASVSDVAVSLQEDAKVRLSAILIYDMAAERPISDGYFQKGNYYYIHYIFDPIGNYAVENYDEIRILSPEVEIDLCGAHEGTLQVGHYFYTTDPVKEVALTVTGVELGAPISGVQVSLPEDANVTLEKIEIFEQFLGDYVTTGNFENGCMYTLYYVLKPKFGYNVNRLEEVTVNGEYVYFDAWDDTITVEQDFSTCEPVGEVRLTSSGVELGAPVNGVQLQINEGAKVTLESIEVHEYDEGEVTEGNFLENRNYRIVYFLRILEGYSADDGIDLTLNDQKVEISWEGRLLRVAETFSTCKRVETVELTVKQPQIGDAVNAVEATSGTEQCYVNEIWVYDRTEEEYIEEGIFQAGHAYRLEISLYPAENYIFDENTRLILNGQEKQWAYVDMDFAEALFSCSFQEKIQKVELSAVPESLKIGDPLPEITIPQEANYTLEAQWIWTSQDHEQTEEANSVRSAGIYRLSLQAWPKKGYEFADSLQVTAGGRPFTGYVLQADPEDVLMGKTYSINMQVIDRIDITVADPRVGAPVQMPGITTEGCVLSRDWGWMAGETNDLYAADMIEIFPAEKIIYLYMIMGAEPGYAIRDDVQIWVNGRQLPVVARYNAGYAVQLGVNFGRLQNQGSLGQGDIDGLMGITEDDAIYLLQHVLMPGLFPVEQAADFDGSGSVNEDDAIYLLQHVLMPGLFPLHQPE